MIDEATGVMKVNAKTRAMTARLLLRFQVWGFKGSSLPFQSMRFGVSSEVLEDAGVEFVGFGEVAVVS